METIPGEKIGLPLVTHITVSSIHSAKGTQTWHSHQGFELLFVLAGSTAWEFHDSSAIEVTGGQFLAIPSGVVHRSLRSMRRPSSICGLLFNPAGRDGAKNATFVKRDLRWLNDYFTNSALTIGVCGGELMSRLNRLVLVKRTFEADPRNPILKATLRTLACSIILEATRKLQAAPSSEPALLVKAAKDYLQQHIQEPVRMADLIKHIGFSRSHLFAIFKSITGMTPNDYFVRIRIEKAQKLLLGTSWTVTGIALDTGFSSSQYFSNVFRKHTGQTPVEYRRNAGLKPLA